MNSKAYKCWEDNCVPLMDKYYSEGFREYYRGKSIEDIHCWFAKDDDDKIFNEIFIVGYNKAKRETELNERRK